MYPTTVVGNSGSPAKNTARARLAVAAAALAAVVANNQVDDRQREHRKHNPMTHKLELNEVAHAVLEQGDKILNYRQLIHHPAI